MGRRLRRWKEYRLSNAMATARGSSLTGGSLCQVDRLRASRSEILAETPLTLEEVFVALVGEPSAAEPRSDSR